MWCWRRGGGGGGLDRWQVGWRGLGFREPGRGAVEGGAGAGGEVRYPRFDPGRLGELRKAGIDVVSLANNHAADAGVGEIAAAVGRIREAGLGVVGAGKDLAAALCPWRGSCEGVELAVFGVCAVDAPGAGGAARGVAVAAARGGARPARSRRRGRVGKWWWCSRTGARNTGARSATGSGAEAGGCTATVRRGVVCQCGSAAGEVKCGGVRLGSGRSPRGRGLRGGRGAKESGFSKPLQRRRGLESPRS